jgi:hypothetical protein
MMGAEGLTKATQADCNFSTTEIWGSDICPRCEEQGVSERIELNRIGALKVGLNY